MGGKSTEGIDFSTPAENGAHVNNVNLKDESHLKGTMSGDLTGVGEEEDEEDEEEVCAEFNQFFGFIVFSN